MATQEELEFAIKLAIQEAEKRFKKREEEDRREAAREENRLRRRDRRLMRPPLRCYTCGGPHLARYCDKRRPSDHHNIMPLMSIKVGHPSQTPRYERVYLVTESQLRSWQRNGVRQQPQTKTKTRSRPPPKNSYAFAHRRRRQPCNTRRPAPEPGNAPRTYTINLEPRRRSPSPGLRHLFDPDRINARQGDVDAHLPW